ncbi:MAG: hypothetical protein AUK31_03080 [Fibrobacteres bacterium CG2_30_45_31]|nr:MAG: hypothetical protein AUK31_03080 [Fibrobacteres bacterium CG2_30_45_31]
MANKIESIISFVATGVDGVQNKIKSIQSPTKNVTNSVDKLHSSIQRLTNVAGITASIQAVGAAKSVIMDTVGIIKGAYDTVFNAIKEYETKGDTIAKTSRLVGLSVKEYQSMQYAASLSGIEIETLDTALKKFTINTGNAVNGNKALNNAFEALGVKTRNSDDSIRSNKDIILDVADAYTKLTSVQDKNLISQTLFGKSGLQMSELFSGGKKGLEAVITEFDALGGGMSEFDTKNAEEFDDSLFRMNTILDSIKIKILGPILPAFTRLFDKITDYVKNNGPTIDKMISTISDKVPGMLDTIATKVPSILNAIGKIVSTIASVVNYVDPWKSLILGMGVVIGGAILTATLAFGAAIAAIAPVVTGLLIPAIGAIAATLLPILPTIGMIAIGIIAWKEVITSVIDNWDMLKSFIIDDCLGGIMKTADSFINKISSGFTWVGDKIKSVFTAVKDTVLDVIRTVLNQYLSMADKITSTLSNLPGVGDIFKDVNIGVHAMMDSDFMNPQRQENSESMQQITQSYTETRNNTSTQRFAVDFSGMPRGVVVKPPERGGDFDYSAGYLFGGGV